MADDFMDISTPLKAMSDAAMAPFGEFIILIGKDLYIFWQYFCLITKHYQIALWFL